MVADLRVGSRGLEAKRTHRFFTTECSEFRECAELRFVAFRSSGMVAPTDFAWGEMERVERDEARKQGDLFSPQRAQRARRFLTTEYSEFRGVRRV